MGYGRHAGRTYTRVHVALMCIRFSPTKLTANSARATCSGISAGAAVASAAPGTLLHTNAAHSLAYGPRASRRVILVGSKVAVVATTAPRSATPRKPRS